MGYFLMLVVDAVVLVTGFMCLRNPEKICKGDSWKTADGEFEPSEPYVKSTKQRGVILVAAGFVLLAFIAVMVYLGIKEGHSFTASEFFEWFISRRT